jgi:hypothetical protein
MAGTPLEMLTIAPLTGLPVAASTTMPTMTPVAADGLGAWELRTAPALRAETMNSSGSRIGANST